MSGIENRKRIESLYVLKAICAFFVVSIHVPVTSPLMMSIAGVGTPCFLCITGYLLFSENTDRELKKCKAWAIKTFWLAVVFNLLYGVINFYVFGAVFPLHSKRFYIYLLFFGTGMHHALWYLTALCEALMILYCIIRYAPRLIYGLPLLYVFAFVLRNIGDGYYFESLSLYSATIRNTCIVTTLPFLATGYLLHKYQQYMLRAINVNLTLSVFLVLALVEVYVRKVYNIPQSFFLVCTYPLVVLLMLFCVQHSSFTVPVLGNIGKNHSPNIYYFHGLFISILEMATAKDWSSISFAFVVYMLCLPCSFMYNFLSSFWKKYVWEPVLNRVYS